jgi:hypothetical protein
MEPWNESNKKFMVILSARVNEWATTQILATVLTCSNPHNDNCFWGCEKFYKKNWNLLREDLCEKIIKIMLSPCKKISNGAICLWIIFLSFHLLLYMQEKKIAGSEVN